MEAVLPQCKGADPYRVFGRTEIRSSVQSILHMIILHEYYLFFSLASEFIVQLSARFLKRNLSHLSK